MFPDEFHLNTLDQLLPAIARLNPHVNIKAIVIGLMNRLSTYAERESESEPPEDRKRSEEEATAQLLEKLKISKESKAAEAEHDIAKSDHTNGNVANGDNPSEVTLAGKENAEAIADKAVKGAADDDVESTSPRKSRGIPEDVKLYEIFYGQVTHLVHAQRLPIQDTIALLVSLANLAL